MNAVCCPNHNPMTCRNDSLPLATGEGLIHFLLLVTSVSPKLRAKDPGLRTHPPSLEGSYSVMCEIIRGNKFFRRPTQVIGRLVQKPVDWDARLCPECREAYHHFEPSRYALGEPCTYELHYAQENPHAQRDEPRPDATNPAPAPTEDPDHGPDDRPVGGTLASTRRRA